MYDINFFSVYKRKNAKNNGLKIFIIVFALLFILSNVILILGGLVVFRGMEDNIAAKEAYINSPETKAKIAEAAKIRQEATLTGDYLTLLDQASIKIQRMNVINTSLINKIRQLTPATTQFTFTEYSGISVKLSCKATVITDPMDMYHAFRNDPNFINVSMGGISFAADGTAVFNMDFQLAGGEIK